MHSNHLRAAVTESASDLHAEAIALEGDTTSDIDFVTFVKGVGNPDWLPFQLPPNQKDMLALWQSGESLPGQAERREFVEHIRDNSHPSLL